MGIALTMKNLSASIHIKSSNYHATEEVAVKERRELIQKAYGAASSSHNTKKETGMKGLLSGQMKF